jgi:hypothetical protein
MPGNKKEEASPATFEFDQNADVETSPDTVKANESTVFSAFSINEILKADPPQKFEGSEEI